MRLLKTLTAALCGLTALVVIGTATPASAQGPAYLPALSCLRTARDYINSDHRPEFKGERKHAVDEINKAIDEIKHAAWDDGKMTQYATGSQGVSDPWAPLREAQKWLASAHKHVLEGPDLPQNAGLRERAVLHIDEAHHTVDTIVNMARHGY